MKRIFAFALGFIAQKIISKYKPKIIGITGSFGKSSTKEAIFCVLSGANLNVRRSRGNLNNELGLPLAIIGDFHYAGGALFYITAFIKGLCVWFINNSYPDILVLEYGADKPGDIKYLTSIARPDIAVVTGISDIPVHVEFYDSPEDVATEKCNLVKILADKGTTILNADDPLVAGMADKTNASCLFYGFSSDADVQIKQFTNRSSNGAPLGVSFEIKTEQKSASIIIDGVLGRGTAYTVASAVACGSIFGIELAKSAEVLSSLQLLPGRARIIEGNHNIWIIDDSYNASLSAVLESLVALESIQAKRKIAVLGGMMELGKYSDKAHKDIGQRVATVADIVIGIGDKGKQIISAVSTSGVKTMWFESSILVAEEIKKIVQEGDVVLVKGSQSVRAERIVKALMKHPEKADNLLVRQYGKWLK